MPRPDFLDLPARTTKPRRTGITHVLDAGLPVSEAPREGQQAWFVRRFGPDVNLANISPAGALGLETLRLSLRADTYRAPSPIPAAACGT
jgi:phosphosulfolactate synthase (CoM biosynthesis protein A)